MKQILKLQVADNTFYAEEYTCDYCKRKIDVTKEPAVIDHSTLTLVHPRGADGFPFREIVHKPNDPAGFFNEYCIDCALGKLIPFMSNEEVENIANAIERKSYELQYPTALMQAVRAKKDEITAAKAPPIDYLTHGVATIVTEDPPIVVEPPVEEPS